MIFKDWKDCSQDEVNLDMEHRGVYYIHAQAWHIKGYLGGRHSWLAFYSRLHRDFLVCEYTTKETLIVQDAITILYDGSTTSDITEHAPFISLRKPNTQWFGHDPKVVASSYQRLNYRDVEAACMEYPRDEFNLLTWNCNTFTSFMLKKLGIDIKPPLLAIGAKRWSS